MLQFLEHKTPFSPLTREDTVRHMETVGKRILPILDFIRSTQLNVGISGVLSFCPVCEHQRFLAVLKAEEANIAFISFCFPFLCFALFLERRTENHIYKTKHMSASESIPFPFLHMFLCHTGVPSACQTNVSLSSFPSLCLPTI